jgi:hypothetical protein
MICEAAISVVKIFDFSHALVVRALRVAYLYSRSGFADAFFDLIPRLPGLLSSQCNTVVETCCACTVSLCTGSLAIESFICTGGCKSLCGLLFSPCESVIARAINTIHALSLDLNFCKEICECGGVPLLSLLLETALNYESISDAAGALQNIGREKSSGAVLVQTGTAESVVPLLTSSEPSLQAAAVGVLLNMHHGSDMSRCVLRTVLSAVILGENIEACGLT